MKRCERKFKVKMMYHSCTINTSGIGTKSGNLKSGDS